MFGLWRSDPVRDAIKAAWKVVKKGSHQEAFTILRRLLPNEQIARNRKLFIQVLKIVDQMGTVYGDQSLSGHLLPCINDPDDPEHLYELGCELIEHGAHAFASLPLQRLYYLEPDDPVYASALITTYEGLFMSEEIVALIKSSSAEVREDPECYYLLAFHEVMTNAVEQARARLPEVQAMVPEDQWFLPERLGRMIERADVIKSVTGLTHTDLVGWHYVKTGGVLTHVSPFGYHGSMHGRYAMIQDQLSLCHYSIVRLKQILDAWDLHPPLVYFGRDRSSRIMATAVGQLLGLPLEPLAQAVGPGLIVIYDLNELEGDDLERITFHHPGRILFVHTLNWVEKPSLSPDVVTYLHQFNFSPWAMDLPMVKSNPYQPTVQQAADDILEAELPEEDVISYDPDLTALAQATRGQASIFRTDGFRERFWQGGPVKSAMFL